jgi:hypothetical protein
MRAILLILSLLVSSQSAAQTLHSPSEKSASILKALASSKHRLSFAATAARLHTNTDLDRAYRDLDTLLSKEYGDMFWMYGITGFYFTSKELLPDTIQQKIRWAWKHLTPYRGDTENHFLMYYSSLFLMSEVWPDLRGSEWFTGQSSKEIQKESREYLLHWIDQVSKYGLNEFDSPRYQYYFYTPILFLSQFAKDQAVRDRATLLLEMLLADHATKYVNGNFVGAHSRTVEASALTGTIGEINGYSQYFFEDTVTNIQPDLGYIAIIGYECPEIIKQIAKTKNYPFELFESKQERPALRYNTTAKPVAKYTYIDSSYSIGSVPGGIIQPIQQQSWKLVFHDHASPNTITGLHPYRSAMELATYFPEEPSFQAERIENTKAGYSSENKWIGGSPYERINQYKGALLVEYDIPPGVESQHSDLFITKGAVCDCSIGDTIKVDSTVTIKYNDVGLRVTAVHSSYVVLQEAQGLRLRSLQPVSGWMITVGGPVSDASKLKAQSLRRNRDASRYLYRSPYINSRRGSGVVTISFGKKKRVLNFRTGSVQER